MGARLLWISIDLFGCSFHALRLSSPCRPIPLLDKGTMQDPHGRSSRDQIVKIEGSAYRWNDAVKDNGRRDLKRCQGFDAD